MGYRELYYKLQGDGRDSWICIEYEDDAGTIEFTRYMIYDLEVPNWKLKAELSNRGMLTNVETALASLAEPMKSQANLAWEYSPTINFKSQATALIQASLGLDDEETLQIFMAAEVIELEVAPTRGSIRLDVESTEPTVTNTTEIAIVKRKLDTSKINTKKLNIFQKIVRWFKKIFKI
jgi:hypothetical protein